MSYSKATVAKEVNGNVPKKANNSTLKDNAYSKEESLKKFPIIKKPTPKER